jgi:hypothetical protein
MADKEAIIDAARGLETCIRDLCPNTLEKSVAIEHLRRAVKLACASMDRKDMQ